MSPLRRVLLVFYHPMFGITDGLRTAFLQCGIQVDVLYYAACRTLFDQFVIHTTNKWLHNLKLQPKSAQKFKNHPLSHQRYFEDQLIKKVESFSPDLILLVRGQKCSLETLTRIRKEARLYGWWVEKSERCVPSIADEIHCFDWYFSISRQCVETLREEGHAHVSYQNHLVNDHIFRPRPDGVSSDKKRYDACFVGLWSRKRQKFIEAALEVTKNIAVYGPKWHVNNLSRFSVLRRVKGTFILGDKLVDLYRKTAVVLNTTEWEGINQQGRSGMNMRVLEVPACGSFLLTDTSVEMGDFLTPGLHMGTYETLDDFQSKLAYYIGHPEECKQIAFQGMQHLQKQNLGYSAFIDKIVGLYQSGETIR